MSGRQLHQLQNKPLQHWLQHNHTAQVRPTSETHSETEKNVSGSLSMNFERKCKLLTTSNIIELCGEEDKSPNMNTQYPHYLTALLSQSSLTWTWLDGTAAVFLFYKDCSDILSLCSAYPFPFIIAATLFTAQRSQTQQKKLTHHHQLALTTRLAKIPFSLKAALNDHLISSLVPCPQCQPHDVQPTSNVYCNTDFSSQQIQKRIVFSCFSWSNMSAYRALWSVQLRSEY